MENQKITYTQKQIQKKTGAIIVRSILMNKQKMQKLKKFYFLLNNANLKKQENAQNLVSLGSGALSENNLYKIQQLEDQLYRWQNQN